MLKGRELECAYSKIIHKEGTPLLISPKLLRSLGAGQVDIANIIKKDNLEIINLYEIKSSTPPSKDQIKRLKRSQLYISSILDRNVRLLLCIGTPKQKFSIYSI